MSTLLDSCSRRKPVEQMRAESAEPGKGLKKALNAWDLTAIGIGCIIGVGIFVLPGVEAARHAGPGIILSFVIAGITCAFTAFSYAELASMIPISGSAYTYGYVAFGELIAWIIGWDLVLEYMVSASLVAIGWSSYFNNILQIMGLELPPYLLSSPFADQPGIMNLPAIVIVSIICTVLIIGIKTSARLNIVMVTIKLAAIILFILLTARHVNLANWHPFMPFGFTGVMTASSIVFLAFVGFDAVSTAAEETIRPGRDLPIGIITSLAVASVLYIAVSAIMTGIVPYKRLGVADPLNLVLNTLQMPWASSLVSVAAVTGISSVLLALLLGQPRIIFSMARDGLFPQWLASVHPRFRTPHVATFLTGLCVATMAGLLPIHVVAELASIGTLFAYLIACTGVLVLRVTSPDTPRAFRVPLAPVISPLGILCCAALMISLPGVTWMRFLVWLLLGLAIYFCYGIRKSSLAEHGIR
jgi:APA family basic amino acid/polyamine antiporter